MRKGLDERIDEGVLQWFGHVERMGSDIITKRVYIGECAVSCSLGRPQKRWVDTVECLKKRGLSAKQGKWSRIGVKGVCEGECMGRNPEDEPLTLARCHSCGLTQLYEAFERRKCFCG